MTKKSIWRILAILTAVTIVLTTTAGCASSAPQSATPAPQSTSPAAQASSAAPAQSSSAPEAPKTDFPKNSIDMTILFGAGAGADIVGRKLADIATRNLGQPVVCNNRTGGGGAVGYQYVLSTKPDGYNICWNSTSINVVYHQGNMEQDYSAFRGVACITEEANAIAIKAGDPRFSNFEEFVAYAKEHPGELVMANSGIGSFNHLIAAAVENAVGAEFKHIPLDANESTTALLGGKVDAISNMAFDIIQQENAGTMKALVVVSEERLDLLPDVPTLKELGYDFSLAMWRGITVPKDTPDEVVAVLEKAFLDAVNDPSFIEFAAQNGVKTRPLPGKDFDKLMADSDAIVAGIMEKISASAN